MHDRLAGIAPACAEEALQHLAAGTAPRIPQDKSLATYAPKLEREHGRIDWSRAGEVIERKIRAFDPWPGAFTTVCDQSGRERKLKIFRAAALPEAGSGRFASDADGLIIGGGDGALQIAEAQLEGKKRMSARLLRGHPWLATDAVASRRP